MEADDSAMKICIANLQLCLIELRIYYAFEGQMKHSHIFCISHFYSIQLSINNPPYFATN